MSCFGDRLARLRNAAHHGTRGVTPAHALIERGDLIELLRQFDRLDTEARASQMKVEIVNRYNQESCTLRMTIVEQESITDIIEGPMRFMIERIMLHVSPKTKLRLRKVMK